MPRLNTLDLADRLTGKPLSPADLDWIRIQLQSLTISPTLTKLLALILLAHALKISER